MMQRVTKEQFYAIVNPLNVGPAVDVSTLKHRCHVSYWRMLDGTRALIGKSESDAYGIEQTSYFLTREPSGVG
jgi:hypothetical protein